MSSDPQPPRTTPSTDDGKGTQKTISAGGREFKVRWIVVGALAVYAFVFVLLNDDRVRVDFVFFSAEIGLVWALLLALALGLVIGLALPRLRSRS